MTPQEIVVSTLDSAHPPGKSTCVFSQQINHKENSVRKYDKRYSYSMPLYFASYIFVQRLKPLDTHTHPMYICKQISCFKNY